jgi:hypothetical protein
MKSANDNTPEPETPAAKKKLRLGEFKPLAQFDHVFSGARLILARKAHKDGAAPSYIVAWVAPWQKSITEYDVFASAADARAAFAERKTKQPPATPSLTRDFQVSRVYKWEEENIDSTSVKITPEQMRRVVTRIAQDFNMAAPKLTHREPRARKYITSHYHIDEHSIEMQHKNLSAVLHELAHAIDISVNGNKWAHHGPSFVRTLIRLADKYQFWHDPQELEESAKAAGILVAPESAVPGLPQAKPAAPEDRKADEPGPDGDAKPPQRKGRGAPCCPHRGRGFTFGF